MGKIRSITVPAILAVTVLIAGFFAISPVEQASTVHTQIIGAGGLDYDDISNTRQSIQVVSGNGAGITTGDTVIIDCDNDFLLIDTYWGVDDLDAAAGEELTIGDGGTDFITVDGTNLIAEEEDASTQFLILGGFANTNTDNLDVQTSWYGKAIDDIVNGGDVRIPLIIFAQGAGNNDIVFELQDSGEDAFDAGDTLTVTALIQTESNANCSVSVNT